MDSFKRSKFIVKLCKDRNLRCKNYDLVINYLVNGYINTFIRMKYVYAVLLSFMWHSSKKEEV